MGHQSKSKSKSKEQSFADKYRSGKGVVNKKPKTNQKKDKKDKQSNNAKNYGLGSATNAPNYGSGRVYNPNEGFVRTPAMNNAPNYGSGSATNAKNYGLGTNEQKNYGLGFPESYSGVYQGKDYSGSSMGNIGQSTGKGITSLDKKDNKKPSTDDKKFQEQNIKDYKDYKANVAGGFTDEVAQASGINNLKNVVDELTIFKKSKSGKEDVKSIMSKVKEMKNIIDDDVTLSTFDKINLKKQIDYGKQNFAKLGYSLNEVMASVGTDAYNKIVGKTLVSRDDAMNMGGQEAVDEVQGIMDNYERGAVFKGYGPDGKPIFGTRQPTIGQVGGDIARNLPDFSGLSKFTPTGMIANLFSSIGKGENTSNSPGGNYRVKEPQEQKFGFGDIPSGANQYLTGDYAKYIDGVNLSGGPKESREPGYSPYLSPSAPVLGAGTALSNAMRTRGDGGGGGQQTQNQGDGGGGGNQASGALSYNPYYNFSNMNYTGGPEQSYLRGGYMRDGKYIGPFQAADGGIANFKDYGY